MTIIAIILPLVAFGLAILWMIRQGEKAKEDYRRRKADEEERAKAAASEDSLVEELRSHANENDEAMGIEGAMLGHGQASVGKKNLGPFQRAGRA